MVHVTGNESPVFRSIFPPVVCSSSISKDREKVTNNKRFEQARQVKHDGQDKTT